jgi:hypothetical protein
MKKIIVFLFVLFLGGFAQAQNGLEGIVVEKYYVSDANDAAGSIGTLPVGSVTWRIYADLATNHKLQAVYGVNGHPLVLNTTTTFFNNEDRGSYIPNWTKAQAADNTVMLDSYFSVGAVATSGPGSEFGILKGEDNATANIVNANGLLINNDPSAGIPLTTRDGFIAGTTQNVQLVGITPANLSMFDNVSQAGSSFSTTNGSIASLNGSAGPTSTNRVLIGQFTTDGILHYELNIQVINTLNNVVTNYVASNPTGNEVSLPSLIGNLGVALASEPTTNGNLTFGATTSSSIVLNFTGGNGARRLVIARPLLAVNANPVDATTYVGNAIFGQGSQVGSGNYVVYNGTGTTVTVTGLNPSTAYFFKVIEFNNGGNDGGENYFLTNAVTGNKTTNALGTTYNWNQAGAGPFDWTLASNWTPVRTAPAPDDILIFGTGSTGTIINNVPSQTIGRISFENNTTISLLSQGASTITVAGNTAINDFKVDLGSTLNLTGTSTVSFHMGNNATGNVFGAINLATTNRMTAAAPNGLKFKSGSSLTTTANYSGGPFGAAANTANSVVFEGGSTYTHNGGDNPFQRTAPSSVVVFNLGSFQVWNTTTGFDANGRAYGNVTLNAVISANNAGAFSVGELTIGATGQLTMTGTGSSSVTIRGNINNNSNLTCSINSGTGGINFTKVGTQTLGGSGTGDFVLLAPTPGATRVVTAGGLSMLKNATFNDLNLVGTGKLIFGAANLTATFNGTILGTGTINAFNLRDANFNFIGATTASIGSLKVNSSINNITINRVGSTSTLLSGLVVNGTVTMTEGTLNSNGFLKLASSATRQGIISGTGNGTVTGNVNVERYVAPSGINNSPARLISCPVSGLTTNTAWGDDFPVVGDYPYVYTTGGPNAVVYPSIWTLDDANIAPQTQYESANTVAISPFSGFFANLGTANSQAKTLDVFGPVNNGALNVNLGATVNGIHYIGNPYPSPIRWSLLRNLPGQVGLQAAYYGWSSVNNAYGYWNGTVGTFGLNDTIFLGQAFSVTTNTPAGGNLISDNTIRHGSNAPTFYRTAQPSSLLKLNIEGEQGIDQVAVYTIPGGVENYNPESDAKKLDAAPGDNTPQLAVLVDNTKLAIKEFEDFSLNKSIPLYVNVNATGFYTFSVDQQSDLNGKKLFFVDTKNNTKVKLNANSKFNVALEAGEYNNRFYINLASTEEVESGVVASLDCFANNSMLSILNGSDETTAVRVELYDLSGKLLLNELTNAASGVSTISIPAISDGIYLVKLFTNDEIVTKKVLIK